VGGGARGVKIVSGGNGASVCLWSVSFFEVVAESVFSARKKKIKKLAGNSSAGPPNRSELFVAVVILWRHSACKYDYHPAWSKVFFFTAVSTNPDRKVCYSYVYESFMYK
jgi:hypothetical protein